MSGAFHSVSPPPPFSFGDMLEAIAAAVAPAGTTLEWVDPDWLRDRNLDDNALPLWAGGVPEATFSAANPAKAYAAGLSRARWPTRSGTPWPGRGPKPARRRPPAWTRVSRLSSSTPGEPLIELITVVDEPTLDGLARLLCESVAAGDSVGFFARPVEGHRSGVVATNHR